MKDLLHLRRCAVLLGALLLITARPCAATSQVAQATTIIGANSQLSDGAAALEAGRVAEGLRLTLAGLNEPGAPRDLAAGHANACAGFILMEQFEAALEHCNQAIRLDKTNWRAFNNRAAIYSSRGLFDLALRDIRAGLQLAPNSPTLHESMRVTQRNKRIMEDRGRHSVPS